MKNTIFIGNIVHDTISIIPVRISTMPKNFPIGSAKRLGKPLPIDTMPITNPTPMIL